MATVMRYMASNFSKLDKFEGMVVIIQPWNKSRGPSGTMMTMSAEDSLKAKYMAEDASNFKHTLKHKKEELTLVELGSHLRIDESLRVQDSDKPKGNNVVGPSVVNMVKHNNSSRYNDNKGKRKHHDNTRIDPNKNAKLTCWKCGKTCHIKRDCKDVNVGNKANSSGTKGSVNGSSNSLKGQNMFNKSLSIYYVTYVYEAYFVHDDDDDVAWCVDSGAIVHVCKDRCWFKTYESLNDGSILHMRNESTALVHGPFMSTSKLNDSILWHARLGHIHFKRMQDMSKDGLISAFDMDTKKFPRPSLRILNGTEDNGSSVVPEKRFKQKSGIDYFDSYALVTRISAIRLLIAMASIHNMIIHQIDVKTAFLNDELEKEVDLTKDFFTIKSYYIKNVLKKFNYFECTPVSTPMDTSEKLMPNNGQAVSQLEYSRVIGCLMYAITCIRPDIAFTVGKLSRYTSNPGTQHWQAIQRVLKYLKKTMDYRLTYTGYPSVLECYTDESWINNTEDNSSISDWVFLLGGGAISGFPRNKLVSLAYSQMYNGKSRHLGVRRSMIHELITNGWVKAHKQRHVRYDLKPDNALLVANKKNNGFIAKTGDIGLAKKVKQIMNKSLDQAINKLSHKSIVFEELVEDYVKDVDESHQGILDINSVTSSSSFSYHWW
nr:zinc finger, CCHC-type [Tanacetum cinerariifolium]